MQRIALVMQNSPTAGGVAAVAAFLHSVISGSGRYSVDVISLATSSSDTSSVRLLSPNSWMRGVEVTPMMWRNTPITHVGAFCSEVEVARYMPRLALTGLLNSYDLVQVVAGSPAWAYSCRNTSSRVCLQVATRVGEERASRLSMKTDPARYWRLLMTKMVSKIEESALSFVDTVFVENTWMYHWVSAHVGSENVKLAPPGVDTIRFCPRDETSIRDPFILSVGRFADKRKNIPLLFRSYRIFRDCVDNPPPLILAGASRPSDLDWLLAEKLGIRQHIRYLGGVSVDELSRLYRNAAMFVLGSDEEGFGIVLVEAMASGIPVVSTRCGGPELIVNDGVDGYLVPVGDADAFAGAMKRLWVSEPVRRRMGERGRKKAVERFSLEAAGKAYLQEYDRLMDLGSTRK